MRNINALNALQWINLNMEANWFDEGEQQNNVHAKEYNPESRVRKNGLTVC